MKTTGNSAKVLSWPQIVACLFGANAADLDFGPGLFVGDLGRFHQGPSHSIDGDLQNDPNDIPWLVAKLNEGYDVVAG